MEILNKLDYTQNRSESLIRKTVAWMLEDKCFTFWIFPLFVHHIASVLLLVILMENDFNQNHGFNGDAMITEKYFEDL